MHTRRQQGKWRLDVRRSIYLANKLILSRRFQKARWMETKWPVPERPPDAILPTGIALVHDPPRQQVGTSAPLRINAPAHRFLQHNRFRHGTPPPHRQPRRPQTAPRLASAPYSTNVPPAAGANPGCAD